jgi:DHA2 family multidrug resistance protein
MTGPDATIQDTRPAVTTHPLLGVAGVLLGALIATSTGRLMSVGLTDIRSALHLGIDEWSWINTAFTASMMFIGPFSVYLGGLLGPRRGPNSVTAGHCCTGGGHMRSTLMKGDRL